MAPRKLFQYTESAMQNALNAIRHQSMPVSTACKKFNVPRTSVRNRLNGKISDNCRKVGPKSALGPEIEQKLVSWILDCSSRGFPINKEGLLYSVTKIQEECDIHTKLLKKVPGRKWFDSFMKRHPEVRQKKAEFISKARAAASEKTIRRWFNHVKELLGTDIAILNSPDRIFNMDETAIFLSPKGSLILGPKGKNVYDVGKSDKDNVTTLVTVNAEGLIAPPLTIYKFKRLPKSYADAAPKNWGIGTSDSGWMQSRQFYEYFANVFIKFLDSKTISTPVIVFVDGHSSHLSLNLSNLCRENGIILICLPPNTTHMLQPLDVAFFYPLKQAWKKIARKWLYEHEGQNIQKKDIPTALNSILTKKDFTGSIKSGFRVCGLYPFDENAPNYDKCLRKDLPHSTEEWKDPDTKEMSRLTFFEAQMDPCVLQSFKTAYSIHYFWQGENRYLELYNLWRSIKVAEDPEPKLNTYEKVETDGNQEEEVTTFNLAITEYSDIQTKPSCSYKVENIKDNIIVFDFPEFSNNIEETIGASEDRTIKTDTNNGKINILQNIVIKAASEISDDFKENLNNDKDIRLLKKRTVSGVLKDLKTWPDDSDEKPKRRKISFPSVVTSEKWIEIFEAKERSKQKLAAEKAAKRTSMTDKINKTKNFRKKKVNDQINNENNEIFIDSTIKKKTMLTKNDIEKSESKRQTKENIEDNGEQQPTKEDSNKKTVVEETTLLDVGSYVIVKYDGELYPAKILNKENNECYCCAMRQSEVKPNHWKWPDSPDLLWYKDQDIVLNINEPRAINTRGICVVPEIESLL